MTPNTQTRQAWPNWYYGWNILGAGFIFQAVIFGLTFYCFTFWIEPWVKEFNTSRSSILFIVLLVQGVMGLAAPFAGQALDRFSIRVLIIIGILCYSLALALAATATALWQITLYYCIFIVTGCLLAGSLAAQTLIAKWFVSKRSLAMGLVAIGSSVGGFLLPPLVTWLLAEYGWRNTNLILALSMSLVLIPLVWLVVRNKPEDLGLSLEADTLKQSASVLDYKFPHWTTKKILGNRSFWIIALSLIPVAAAFGAFSQNLGPLAKDLGIEAQEAAWMTSTMALAMIVGKVFFGGLADRLDHRYLFWTASGSAVLVFLILFATTPNYSLMFVVSALIGISAGGILPLIGAATSTRFGTDSFGQVVGLLTSLLVISALAPWAVSYIRDLQGSYDNAWLLLVCILLASMPIAAWLPKPPGEQQSTTAVSQDQLSPQPQSQQS